MCGICGIISNVEIDTQAVKRMNNALIHRGPNGEGFYNENGVSLGMRRLSIIDHDSSWQPLFNEDNSIALMLNGEIYNYLELRDDLIKKGHSFKTKGDGETIVHLYEEYGISCIDHLRGMFAFALHDKKQNIVYLVRDRMGEKPLYLFKENNTVTFSSELRSLMSSKKIKLDLDPFAIDLFFHYHYIPEPYTAIKDVIKLPAANYLKINLQSMQIDQVSYWQMEDARVINTEPIETIKQQLNETGKLVIRADVPIGVALSGGIDSGIVAALARKNYNGNLHAISIGYEGKPESDERSDAKLVAEHLGLTFHQVELSNKDFISNFPILCGLTDDPIADISAFGYFSVSKKAKELGIPVMLQGQGGDELFWGYKWVRDNYKLVKLKEETLNNKPLSLLKYYHHTFSEKTNHLTAKSLAKGVLSFKTALNLRDKHLNEDEDVFPLYDYFKSFNWDKNYLDSFYGDFIKSNVGLLSSNKPFKVKKPWKNDDIILTKLICNTYLLENGMAQGDRLSMSNSVELRLPLVDYKFVETVIGLRKKNKDIELEPKYWLKQAGKELLPEWLFTRKKRGFEPPVEKWLSDLVTNYGSRLPEGHLVNLGIINKEVAIKMSKGFYDPRPAFPSYFNALVLEFWYDNLYKLVNEN
jgi:asparagine synthase (glutamine-hydrolysing)